MIKLNDARQALHNKVDHSVERLILGIVLDLQELRKQNLEVLAIMSNLNGVMQEVLQAVYNQDISNTKAIEAAIQKVNKKDELVHSESALDDVPDR